MKTIAIAGLFLWLGAAAVGAQEQSTASGVFTEDQAKNGEKAYQAQCAACHGLDLHKVDPEASDLTDGPFRFGWNGKTMGEQFVKIRDTMPKANAKSLDDQTYLDILTYILHFNGIPTGQQKLAPDVAALEKIAIAVPAAQGGSRRRR